MTLTVQTVGAAARALGIAALALTLAPRLARLLAHAHGRQRTVAWALLLAPLLTPALLVSYAYSHLALRLMGTPGAISALYFAALALKLVPVAAIILHFVPPALSAEAAHVHALLCLRSTNDAKGRESRNPFRILSRLSRASLCGVWFRVRGAGPAPWLAGGVVFLLAFTDFELASLWSLKTWTVALFDAQAGGLALGASLRLTALPLAFEIAVLALILRPSALSIAPAGGGKTPGRIARPALLAYLSGAALLACGWPLGFVAVHAVSGFRAVAENFVLANDLAASLGLAAGAAVVAWGSVAAAGRWHDDGTRHTRKVREKARKEETTTENFSRASAIFSRVSRFFRRPASAAKIPPWTAFAFLLAGPGLLGALLLSLLVLTAFQLPGLHATYDTPLPLLVALTLLLLPFALPLRWLLDAKSRDPALHLAKMANAEPIVWQLETRHRWLAAFLLFCWAYFDFTAGSILAPVGLTPVFVRLHNLAHYGQTAVLSAMFLAAFAAPVAVLLLTAPLARWYARR